MARVGGRNAAFAWVVGLGCLAILGLLAALAVPMIPASVAWFGGAVENAQGTAPTSAPVAAAGDDEPTANNRALAVVSAMGRGAKGYDLVPEAMRGAR